MGRENDRISVMGAPFGSVTITWKNGAWVWDQPVPKCVYGADPCPQLEERHHKIIGPQVAAWLEAHKPIQ